LLSEYGGPLWAKFRFGLLQHARQPIYQHAFYSLLAYLLCFGLLPWRKFPGDRRVLLFVRFVLAMVCMHVLAESLSYPNPRFSYPYRGLILIAVVLLADGWLRSFRTPAPARRRLIMSAALLAAASPGLLTLVRDGVGPAPLAGPRVPVAELQALVPLEAVIASDVSHALALDVRRRSVRLPTYPEDLLTLDADVRPIDFVYVSRAVPLRARRTEPQATVFHNYVHYAAFLNEPRFLERYRIVQLFPDGGRLFGKREGPY
jgi:hypothetical protein